jgi:hypothetical protein
MEAEEVAMTSFVRPAWLALAFVATAVPASAQTWVYESDVPRARVYEPRSYYEPRAYESPVYEPRAYEPVVTAAPLALTPAQRTTIYRTGSAYAYAVGSRVGDAYALAPMPQAVVSTVPAVRSYRYMVINNRLLLVDPATGLVVAEMTD